MRRAGLVRRAGRWGLGVIAGLALLAAAALLTAPWLVNLPRVRTLLGHAVARSLGRPVRLGAVEVAGLRPPRVVLRDVEVADDPAFHTGALLTLPEAEVWLRLRALLGLRLEVAEVALIRPVLSVVRRRDGQWNLAGLGRRPEGRAGGPPRGSGSGGSAEVTGRVPESRIEGGTVTVTLEHGGASRRYRLEDLRGRVRGVGPAAVIDLQGRLEPGTLAFTIRDGRVVQEGGRGLAEAAIQGRLHVESPEVAAFLAPLAGPDVAVRGPVRGGFALGGTVRHPRLSGEIESPRTMVTRRSPRCPGPAPRSVVVEAIRLEPRVEGGILTAPVVQGRVGDGRIVASVTAALDGRGEIDVTSLALQDLPLEVVLADFLCERYAVTGPLDLTGRTRFQAGAPWTTLEGQGRLRIGPGRVVGPQALRLAGALLEGVGLAATGLDAEVPGVLSSAPLEFESISATYRVHRGVIETTDLLYTARRVRARVAGRYALATGEVNADVVVEHRRGEVRARVTGTAAAPVIRVSPATLLRAVDRPAVERGLRELLQRMN